MEIKIEMDRGFDKISKYRWFNIELGSTRIGKVRILSLKKRLIINSIIIFPEFERNGYAREVIDRIKDTYEEIVADRVRNRAIGFWQKMDFFADKNGNYIWKKNNSKRGKLTTCI